MKKSGLIFVIIVAVLLVSGQGCEKREKKGEGVFIGGKSGLVAEFVDDAPSISGNFRNEDIPIEIRLVNKGETDVAAGAAKIYLTGALFSLSGDVVSVDKKEASNADSIVAIEEGADGIIEDSIVVSMGNVEYKGEIFADSVPLDVSAAVCYPYETKIQINDFCIPSTVKRSVGEDECSIDSTKNIINENDNSGAPVHITSLREDKGLDYIRITLDINNVGSGDVVNECKRDISREEMNTVKVTMPSNFKCTNFGDSNTGNIELRNGHATLRCRRDVSNSGNAYKEPVLITLGSYFYRQELSKTISINKE